MSNEYVRRELDKIFSSEKNEELALALSASWIMANFKGVNLKIYHTNGMNPLAEYFVIGSVQNAVQAQSVANSLERELKERTKIKSIEGVSSGEWILFDTGDIIVHIFQDHLREVYDLDYLWKDYPQVKIPHEFYHSEPIIEQGTDSKLKNYFS